MAAEADGLLIKAQIAGGFGLDAAADLHGAEVVRVTALPFGTGLGVAAAGEIAWLRQGLRGEHPWDEAHDAVRSGMGIDGQVLSAEPDMAFAWPMDAAASADPPHGQNGGGGRQKGPHFAWHLDDGFSGLRAARFAVPANQQAKVLIAHLDTGYDPGHASCPEHVEEALERNFTDEGAPNSARDVTPANPLPTTNRGHGSATLALLAGRDPGNQPDQVTGPLGGAPGCRVLPIRVGDSVIRLRTSTLVKGFDYALAQHADVLSMSMGGITSDALAQVVNDCYEAGMVLVTAAGNFVEGVPSPRSIVYPARHRRVIAATGVMANGAAYDNLAGGTLAGCHGPGSNMPFALAAWTPNTFWARIGEPHVIDQDGQGTSASTPQIAAAAALWIAANRDRMASYPERWMKGEAVRQALFRSARTTTALLDADEVRKSLGRGTLDAEAALRFAPLAAAQLVKAPVADASRYVLNLLTGTGSGVAETVAGPRLRMLALEIAQIAQVDPAADAWLREHDEEARGAADRREFLTLVRDSRRASDTLRRALDLALDGRASSPARAPKPSGKAERSRDGGAKRSAFTPPVPKKRRLQIFVLDPSLGVSLATFEAKIATVDVRYEVNEHGNSLLRPGPVGEYVEVVDIDPASDRFYPPVDLDHPHVLLSDGLTPSEGNPQFHQQMVYAVAMRTIAAFEDALGRKTIWAPHRTRDGGRTRYAYTQRLRIYPHALRARNAYYSPERVALLFGYFPAEGGKGASSPEGTLVYAALSADIIAHETTHALLDGYTPGYREQSNPDVGAFHEAFADVVALLQHFQFEDLVRRQISEARGDLGAASLLAGIAKQFGEGTGNRGALRDYLTSNPDFSYRTTFKVHDRGSILVRTIYLVLLAIFERRAADLITLATDGSGVLRPGALRPELADRLAREATRVAGEMLRMCIRALDYCPPVDITFGSYLRALITADLEHVDTERLSYRTAFLEQFRAADLLPTNLRTASVDTLRWQQPEAGTETPAWLPSAVAELDIDWRDELPRELIYEKIRERCAKMHELLQAAIAADPGVCELLGLEPGLPLYEAATGKVRREVDGTAFEVRSVRAARRRTPGGDVREEIIIVLVQRRPVFVDDAFAFMFHGGCTLVIDPGHPGAKERELARPPRIRYSVVKRLRSSERLDKETSFRTDPSGRAAQALYFDERWNMGEPFAALHAVQGDE